MFETLRRPICCALALACVAGPTFAAPEAGAEAKNNKPALVEQAALPPSTAANGPRLIGDLETTTTKYEDTLVHMARKYNVGFVELRAANPGIDPWLPGDGTKITIPTQHIVPDAPHQGVVINLPEMRMYFYFDPNQPPATYPIGIGRSGLTTPLGTTTIARMTVDPVWRPTDRMRAEDPTLPVEVPPGPENPMGTHAMYLGWASYAIHGTDKPYSIGRRLSSGCIRMYPEDIITLFDNVHTGTAVTVVDQPVKTAWVDDKYYVQVHPTQEQSDTLSHDGTTKPSYPLRDADIKTILQGVEGQNAKVDWTKLRTAVKERRGIPIVVATRNGAKDDAPPPKSPEGEKPSPDKQPLDKQPPTATPDPAKDVSKDATKDAVKDVAKDTPKDIVKDAPKDTAKDTVQNADDPSAGAKTPTTKDAPKKPAPPAATPPQNTTHNTPHKSSTSAKTHKTPTAKDQTPSPKPKDGVVPAHGVMKKDPQG